MGVAVSPRRERRREVARAGAGGPRYPGWLALPAVGWYALFFLGPLAIMAVFSVAERAGYTEILYTFSLTNFHDLWDPLYGRVFLRTLGLALFGTVATLV